MKYLLQNGLLSGNCLTVTGKTIAENLANVPDLDFNKQTIIYPRSSMAQWIGICGVRLAPLAAALREFVLGHRVVHADETPVQLLAPGRGK